jgi:hypothetical protein
MNEAIIPLKYGKTSTDPSQIMIKYNGADGNENKEECPIFMNGTPDKIMIQMNETIIV